MSDPTGIAPYLVANNSEDALVPNARALIAALNSGLETLDSGPSNVFTLNTIQALQAINNLASTGFIVGLSNTVPYFQMRDLISSDGSVTITNPTGALGNPDFSVTPGISVQKINFFYNTSTPVGTA